LATYPYGVPMRTSERRMSKAFLDWGGFYHLRPISKRTTYESIEKLDHPKMRLLLRKWEKMGHKNPYEFEDDESSAAWIDLVMPRRITRELRISGVDRRHRVARLARRSIQSEETRRTLNAQLGFEWSCSATEPP
jgi:hypothetical protein